MKPLEHFTELQIEEFLKEFTSSNDRVLVIAFVSLLDASLSELLRLHLLASRKKDDELFDSNRPLASFAAKIDLAYRLRLIDGAFADALHCLRNIRNKYAHLVTPGELGSGKQGEFLQKAGTIFQKADAIWWNNPISESFLFRDICLHLLVKLGIGIEPSRKADFPIPLKPSNSEKEFFRLLAGKVSH